MSEAATSEVQVTLESDQVGVVSLLGEHDLATTLDLRETLSHLVEQAPGGVVVDLSETRFIDCSIINTLEVGQLLAAQHGTKLCFQAPSHRVVKRAMELAEATEGWPIYPTRAEAVAAARPDPAEEPQDASTVADALG